MYNVKCVMCHVVHLEHFTLHILHYTCALYELVIKDLFQCKLLHYANFSQHIHIYIAFFA